MSSLRKKLDLPQPKVAIRLFENPYLMLGYGLNSYFSIVVQLMIMMSIIMIVTVPLMLIYASYDDLSTMPGYEFNAFSLGNIGGSTTVCAVSTF